MSQKLYSYWKIYGCGCKNHLHKTPVYEPSTPDKCPLCEVGPWVPEWVVIGKELQQKRRAKRLDCGDIPGFAEDDVMFMEMGRKDPAPLIKFWEEKEVE